MNWMLLLSMMVFASPTPEGELVNDFPKQVVINEIIKLTPINGHHFNLKAPQKCGGKPFGNPKPTELNCQLDTKGKNEIVLSICDDPESFCKTESYSVTVRVPRGYKPNKKKGPRDVFFIPKGERPAPKGFLLNRPERALKSAKYGKKLLFIDFFGHWCPPCNLLDENVFSQKDFTKNTKNLVKIKLDVDSDISWQWKDHFKVGGYPTVVIADHELNEIGRVVGYRPKASMMKWISEMQKLKDLPIAAAIKKRENPLTTESEKEGLTKRIANWYFEREDYSSAIEEWEKVKGSEKNILQARLKIAQKSKDEIEQIRVLTMLLSKYSSNIEAGGWALSLSSVDHEKVKPHLENVYKSLESWRDGNKVDEEGYTKGDLFYYEAKLKEKEGDSSLAKKAYLKCASEYEALAKQSELDVPRGANQERAYCLLKGGKTKEALALYKKLSNAYRGEFAFSYYYARALFDTEDYKKAYQTVKRAVMNSYGDNWLRAVTLKAKIELKLGKKETAERTVRNALRNVVMPSSTQIRSHRYLTALRGVLKEDSK